jgi:hypothetical protein
MITEKLSTDDKEILLKQIVTRLRDCDTLEKFQQLQAEVNDIAPVSALYDPIEFPCTYEFSYRTGAHINDEQRARILKSNGFDYENQVRGQFTDHRFPVYFAMKPGQSSSAGCYMPGRTSMWSWLRAKLKSTLYSLYKMV